MVTGEGVDDAETLLQNLVVQIQLGLHYREFTELANEGLVTIRRALDRETPMGRFEGLHWGHARGWIVVDMMLLTTVALEMLKGRPEALREYARGVGLITEALCWHGDVTGAP
jgi:hypothetical protein